MPVAVGIMMQRYSVHVVDILVTSIAHSVPYTRDTTTVCGLMGEPEGTSSRGSWWVIKFKSSSHELVQCVYTYYYNSSTSTYMFTSVLVATAVPVLLESLVRYMY